MTTIGWFEIKIKKMASLLHPVMWFTDLSLIYLFKIYDK